MTIIIGVDPGLQRTGWGIIVCKNNQLSYIDCGVIQSNPKAPMAERLKALHEGISRAVDLHQPIEAAVEETFVNMNPASTLKLGQARGALLMSLSLAGLPISEYSATMVKKSVVGTGHADKSQVAMMVKTLLPTSQAKGADAADALAVALCHAHQRTVTQLTKRIYS
ncbi:MAG: crossover junction endodeoxyribonuclease RuvC [Rickettsiales bacterium]|nr:crossover junction endodeoxyribonuclease RuvC [Rickettsiales bacterium]